VEIISTLISTARKLVAISRVGDGPELTLYHRARKCSLHCLHLQLVVWISSVSQSLYGLKRKTTNWKHKKGTGCCVN